MANIRQLVFDGSGVGAVANSGALIGVTEQRGFSYENITGTGGVSSGSITALLVALNYTPAQIKQYAFNTDFKKVTAESSFTEIERLFTQFGLYSHTNLINLVKGLFQDTNDTLKGILKEKGDVTFKDLSNAGYKKDFRVVATKFYMDDHGKSMLYPFVFSLFNTPDTSVLWAIAASCAIPGAFPPVRLRKAAEGRYVPDEKGHTYVDGGLSVNVLPNTLFHNLPKPTEGKVIPEFHPVKYLEKLIQAIESEHRPTIAPIATPKNESLGFRIDSASSFRVLNSRMPEGLLNRLDYSFNKFIAGPRDEMFLKTGGLKSTILIKNDVVSSTDFSIDDKQKESLFIAGEKAALAQFTPLLAEIKLEEKPSAVVTAFESKVVPIGRQFEMPKPLVPVVVLDLDERIQPRRGLWSCMPCF